MCRYRDNYRCKCMYIKRFRCRGTSGFKCIQVKVKGLKQGYVDVQGYTEVQVQRYIEVKVHGYIKVQVQIYIQMHVQGYIQVQGFIEVQVQGYIQVQVWIQNSWQGESPH